MLLAGAEVDDIPLELLSSTERFRVERFDLGGLEPLLRSLHGRPDVVKPPLGQVPALPPSYVAGLQAGDAPDNDPHELQSALAERLDAIETMQAAAEPVLSIEQDALATERAVVAGTLEALRAAIETALAGRLPAEGAREPLQDEVAEAIELARRTIGEARGAMDALPPIARETLFQYYRSKAPLTVGGEMDAFGVEDAIRAEEHGYVNWVEDEEQMITPRAANPRVGAAMSALDEVRAVVFGGDSLTPRAHAAPWARLLLRDEYGVEDPEFELRPLWLGLGFLRP